MTTDQRLDEHISRWLEAEAPPQLPERVLRATFERTRRTRQQVGWQAVLGRLQMNRMIFGLASAGVVVVAAVLALGLYFNNPGVGTPPSPSPTTQPTPTPTAEPTTEPTATPEPTSTPDAGLPEGPFDFEDRGMAMTVTIPASGWDFAPEITGFGKGDEVANLPEAAMLFWSWPAGTEFYVYGDPCRLTSTRPDTPATTVDDIATALAAQASRDASEPADVTIGGHAGKSITLHVPDDHVPDECEGGEFASYGVPGDDPARWHQGPGQIDELWILDVDGQIVIINAMYRPDTPAELIEEMRAIAESATFEAP
jgi:hypothetical protein